MQHHVKKKLNPPFLPISFIPTISSHLNAASFDINHGEGDGEGVAASPLMDDGGGDGEVHVVESGDRFGRCR